ncbi:hypothetical protein ACFIQF_24590 [Comamonas sp. J-3]|uniref:hypothetical protein n=1 Tax=Comamonas trifloxystrobinivorans TaxID=3350256 RepID=UPI00372C96AE
MSEKLKPTPGPWQFGEFELYPGAGLRFNISQAEGAEYTPHYSDVANTIPGEKRSIQEANARLIAEAGTVHHESGLSPRELLERGKAMESALQHCEQMLMSYEINRVNHEAIEDEALSIIRAALNKHKQL